MTMAAEEPNSTRPGSEDRAVAWEFRSAMNIIVPANLAMRVNLDGCAEIPTHHCLFILSRADLAKEGIIIQAGFQESQARGSIYVMLQNSTRQDREIRKGVLFGGKVTSYLDKPR